MTRKKRARARELYRQGFTQREVAMFLGVSTMTVQRVTSDLVPRTVPEWRMRRRLVKPILAAEVTELPEVPPRPPVVLDVPEDDPRLDRIRARLASGQSLKVAAGAEGVDPRDARAWLLSFDGR